MKRLIILLVALFFWTSTSWALEKNLSDSLVQEAIDEGTALADDMHTQHTKYTEKNEKLLKLYTSKPDSVKRNDCIVFTPYLRIVHYVMNNVFWGNSVDMEEVETIRTNNCLRFAFSIYDSSVDQIKNFGSILKYQKSDSSWVLLSHIKAECNMYPERYDISRKEKTTDPDEYIFRQGCLHDYRLHHIPADSYVYLVVIFVNGEELTFEFDLSKIK